MEGGEKDNRIPILNANEVGKVLLTIEDFSKEEDKDVHSCPDYLYKTKLCACIDCPNKDGCFLEASSRELGCTRFIRNCSIKNQVSSRESKFSELALEEFMNYIYDKYFIK